MRLNQNEGRAKLVKIDDDFSCRPALCHLVQGFVCCANGKMCFTYQCLFNKHNGFTRCGVLKSEGKNLEILGASREEINRPWELFFVLSEALSNFVGSFQNFVGHFQNFVGRFRDFKGDNLSDVRCFLLRNRAFSFIYG